MPAYDAIIVGARPAGAGTALQLARRGHRVLVLERAIRGSDTLSTHALMRTGVLLLERWGLLEEIVAAGTPPIGRVTFDYAGERVPLDLDEPLYAPRRTVLDPIVADAAAEAGADVRYQVRVQDLLVDDNGRVNGVRAIGPHGELEATAPITVGADGLQSLVARRVGAPITRQGSAAGAFLYGYWEGVATDGVEYLYADGVSAGLIPTNHGRTCVFVGAPTDRFLRELRFDLARSLDRVLAEVSTDAHRRVAAGRQVSRVRGFAGVPGRFHRPHGPGWALVGDAGYFKDPQTAHGITDALRDAELLARAMDAALAGRDDLTAALTAYEQTRDELSVPLFDATEGVADYRWTTAELQPQHLAMSRAMQRETQHMAALTAPVSSRHRSRGLIQTGALR